MTGDGATQRNRFRHNGDVLPTYLFAMHALATGSGSRTRVGMVGNHTLLKDSLARWLGMPLGMVVELSDPRLPLRLGFGRARPPADDGFIFIRVFATPGCSDWPWVDAPCDRRCARDNNRRQP